jgi:uncharacterized protein YjfI (DUF2170 family)
MATRENLLKLCPKIQLIIDITDLNYDKTKNQAEFIQFIPNVESIIALNTFCETQLQCDQYIKLFCCIKSINSHLNKFKSIIIR